MFISSSNIASSSTCKINIKRTLTTKVLSKQHHFSVITIIKSVVRSVSGLVYLVSEVRGDNESKSPPTTKISFISAYGIHRVSIAPPHRHRLNVFTPPESWRNENSWWDIISRLRRPRFYPRTRRWEREREGMSAVWVLLICDTRHMMETSQLLWEFKRGEKRQWEVYSHSQFDLFVYRVDLFIK